jgi:predicted AlkP superfamily pyrophosphatase or phosphodiesterase
MCPLPSATYTCHATLLTGQMPASHRVWSGLAADPQPGVVPGWAGDAVTQVPTLFEACQQAGLKSAAVTGDQFLHSVLRTGAATVTWPPAGGVPANVEHCAFGYLTNRAVLPQILRAARDSSLAFVFAHLNEGDTAGHCWGPDDPETRRCYRATDAAVGEIVSVLADEWDRTVLVVVSDHGMVTGTADPTINLSDGRAASVIESVQPEGGSALVCLRAGVDADSCREILVAIPGVASVQLWEDRVALVVAEPGRRFGNGERPLHPGFHGGADAADAVAIVTGGHPIVPLIGAALVERRPHLADWAPTVATVLGFSLPSAAGKPLIGRRAVCGAWSMLGD